MLQTPHLQPLRNRRESTEVSTLGRSSARGGGAVAAAVEAAACEVPAQIPSGTVDDPLNSQNHFVVGIPFPRGQHTAQLQRNSRQRDGVKQGYGCFQEAVAPGRAVSRMYPCRYCSS